MIRKDRYGRDVHDVTGPFSLANASPRSPDEGGTLDRGIAATLADGRRVLIGEIWAMGPASGGGRISLDAHANADRVVELLNAEIGRPQRIERECVVAVDPDGFVAAVTFPEWGTAAMPTPEDFAARYPRCVGARGKLIVDAETESKP